MKLILSRKGFDSTTCNGGVASPILPGGTLLSLPIPRKESPICYAQLRLGQVDLTKVVADLKKDSRAILDSHGAHLDPDLNATLYHPRLPGWRPIFGQVDAAQAHLERHGTTIGDLFLFFGWFRRVEPDENGHYRFVKGAPDLHVIYGWLQVGEVIRVNDKPSCVPQWASYHPHFYGERGANNTVYIAREILKLDGVPATISGGGVFERYHEDLCLTAPGEDRRSVWRLPAWFYPKNERVPLSYHRNRKRWEQRGGWTFLRSVAKGQEFVMDTEQYPEALEWLASLMKNAAPSPVPGSYPS